MTYRLAFFCLAGSVALAGSYVALAKILVTVFPMFLLALLRFCIAAVAMVGWTQRGEREARLSRHDRKLMFLESFLGNFLISICMLFGISMSSALAAGVIMAGIPAAIALLSRIVLNERLAARTTLGILCAVGGIALVSLARSPHTSGEGSLADNLLLVAAVVCEASYVVIGKKFIGQVGPKRISALINVWGLVLVAPLGIWQASSFDFAAVARSSWGLLVFYSMAASVVTVWLWMTGLKHVPASKAGVSTVLLPVSAAAVGVLCLGERFSAAQGAALALALFGVMLATWPSQHAA